MKAKLTVGVDVMGSDNAPHDLLKALVSTPLPSSAQLLIIGTPELEPLSRPFLFAPALEVIEMDEPPLAALRRKKRSSIAIGMRLLKEKKIDAFVSSGNTGALVSSAKMTLSTFPKISRPALLTLMPTKKHPVAVLDVGGNIAVKASNLVQFAHLGTAYQKTRGIPHPTVGLLNIGSEALKGTSELRLAYQELQNTPSIRFAGNIEGKSVFDGDVDVLITDGFTGNIFLKTAEGIASLILDRIQTHIPGAEGFKDLKKHLHYAEYPGALLIGVKGIVIKCHGYSTPAAFASGVHGAIDLASENFLSHLQSNLVF